MKSFALVIAAIAVTAICWGAYGPIMNKAKEAMEGSRLRPFICVGAAYFLIAVVAPIVLLSINGEPGEWTFGGVFFGFLGGATGAIGALGIILAFYWGGKPTWVMPLVFGFAPVVSTFVAMSWDGSWGAAKNPLFLAGLVLVIMGAVMVLVFGPHAPVKSSQPPATSASQSGVK